MDEKTYLGDGVYASYDGFDIRLTTENGMVVLNEIFLEPDVVEAFVKYVSKVKERAGEQAMAKKRAREQREVLELRKLKPR